MQMARILRAVRVFGEAVMATVFLLAFMGFLWSYFGVHRHMLPMAQSEWGLYGQVEDAQRLTPGTKILKFEATYVPSRILWVQVPLRHFEWTALPWPVPEVIEVHVEYQRPGQKPEEFDRTYLLACNAEAKSRKECVTPYNLIGVKLYGKGVDADGKGGEFGWVYLRAQLMPHPPPPPTKGAQPIKPATPPRPTPHPKVPWPANLQVA